LLFSFALFQFVLIIVYFTATTAQPAEPWKNQGDRRVRERMQL
jgi:hypothetical protein